MGSLRHRLVRLEHDAAPAVVLAPPMTDADRARQLDHWLSQDPATLSDFDRRRVAVMRQVLERAWRRQESA